MIHLSLPDNNNTKGNLRPQEIIKRKIDKVIAENSSNESSLPTFSNDMSELFLSAVIERSTQSNHVQLTNFLLNRRFLSSKSSHNGPLKIDEKKIEEWRKAELSFKGAYYYRDGRRRQNETESFYCKISNGENFPKYRSIARFIPTNISKVYFGSVGIDVFQCDMQNTFHSFDSLYISNMSVSVEIYKGDLLLLSFTVPWRTRRTGYMLTTSVSTQDPSLLSTSFNPWKNYNSDKNSQIQQHVSNTDSLYLLIGTLSFPLSSETISPLLESIEHHVMSGVEHIFLLTTYSSDSIYLYQLLNILRYYINNNYVTVLSQAYDNIDRVASFNKLVFGDIFLERYFLTVFMYYTKSVVRFIAYMNIYEFIIIPSNFNNVSTMSHINHNNSTTMTYSNTIQKLISEMDNSYLNINHGNNDNRECSVFHISVVDIVERNHKSTIYKSTEHWLSQRFSKYFFRRSFSGPNYRFILPVNEVLSYVQNYDYWNSSTFNDKCKLYPIFNENKQEIVMYAYQIYSNYYKQSKIFKNNNLKYHNILYNLTYDETNIYHSNYATIVENSLIKNNLDLLVTVNLPGQEIPESFASEFWPKYNPMDAS
jgi:hypothetical protein